MIIGYARVSTEEQTLDLQLDALKKAGCDKVYTDQISSRAAIRPGLAQALDQLRSDDTLVVWRLDRLGRSVKELIQQVHRLKENGVNFRSLNESIDTTSATGKLQFHIFSSLAEFERDLIAERTLAGLAAARARGRVGGRPPAMTRQRLEMAATMMKARMDIKLICATLGISRSTLYRHIAPNGDIRKGG